MQTPNIPYQIIIVLEIVFSYAKDTEQWIRIKKEVLSYLEPPIKKKFSTNTDKRQHLNEMEKEIIELWVEWGGKRLRVPQDYE